MFKTKSVIFWVLLASVGMLVYPGPGMGASGTRLVSTGNQPTYVAYDPVKNQAVVTNMGDANMSFIDLNTGSVNNVTTGGSNPSGIDIFGREAVVALNIAFAQGLYLTSYFDLDTQTMKGQSRIYPITPATGPGPTYVAYDKSNGNIVSSDGLFHVFLSGPFSSTVNLASALKDYPINNIKDVATYNGPSGEDWAVASTTTGVSGPSIYILDLKNPSVFSGATTITLGGSATPGGLAVNQSTGILVVTEPNDNKVSIVDLNAKKEIGTVNVGNYPYRVAIDESKNRAVVTNFNDNSISVIDLAAKSVIATTPTSGSHPIGVAIDSSRGLAIVANRDSGNVSVIPLPGSTVQLFSPTPTPTSSLSPLPTPSGTFSAAGGSSGSIKQAIIDAVRQLFGYPSSSPNPDARSIIDAVRTLFGTSGQSTALPPTASTPPVTPAPTGGTGSGTSSQTALINGKQVSCILPDLTIRTSADSVLLLQTMLTKEGVYKGPITGYFGNLTKAGVVAFQKKYSLPVTGAVNGATKDLINSLVPKYFTSCGSQTPGSGGGSGTLPPGGGGAPSSGSFVNSDLGANVEAFYNENDFNQCVAGQAGTNKRCALVAGQGGTVDGVSKFSCGQPITDDISVLKTSAFSGTAYCVGDSIKTYVPTGFGYSDKRINVAYPFEFSQTYTGPAISYLIKITDIYSNPGVGYFAPGYRQTQLTQLLGSSSCTSADGFVRNTGNSVAVDFYKNGSLAGHAGEDFIDPPIQDAQNPVSPNDQYYVSLFGPKYAVCGGGGANPAYVYLGKDISGKTFGSIGGVFARRITDGPYAQWLPFNLNPNTGVQTPSLP